METVIYEAKCNDCGWKQILMSEIAIQTNAEAHMMETGHTVEINDF